MQRLLIALILSGTAFAAPFAVTLQGAFRPSFGPPTPFDNQNYSVNFTIADPSAPFQALASPDLAFRSAVYLALAELKVPGLGLIVTTPVQIQYVQSNGDQWLNLFQFSPLPVGDFMLLTPFRTLSATPLWNGLADFLGTPVLNPLSGEPSYSFWRLQQVPTPGLPSIPLAGFESSADSITAAAVPEPSALLPVASSLVALAALRRKSR